MCHVIFYTPWTEGKKTDYPPPQGFPILVEDYSMNKQHSQCSELVYYYLLKLESMIFLMNTEGQERRRIKHACIVWSQTLRSMLLAFLKMGKCEEV